jgi:hypothetical protein
MVFHFAPSWRSNKAYKNVGLIQVFSNKQLGKLAGGVLFASLSFGCKSELSASSPT